MGLNVHCVIGGLRFEWDFDKATSNEEKHGISFNEGANVFRGYHAILLDDPDEYEDEVRLVLLGYSVERQLLIVVYVERGESLRIISVRQASKPERRLYEEKRKG